MTVCRLLSYQDSFSQGLDMYFHKYFLKEKNELVTCIFNSLLKDLIVTIFFVFILSTLLPDRNPIPSLNISLGHP